MKAHTRALVVLTLSASALGAAGASRLAAQADLDRAAKEAAGKKAPAASAPVIPAPPTAPATSPAPAKPALPAAAAVASKPGTAAADNLSIVTETLTIRIPHIEIAGSNLSGDDIVKLFALKDAKAIETRLRGLDATAIDIPEISGDGIDATTTFHWAERGVRLADVKAGRAAAARVDSAKLEVKDDNSITAIATDAITVQGLALAQIAHLAAGPRTDANEPLATLYDATTIAAVTIGDGTKAPPFATIDSLRAAGLRMRPLPKRAPKPKTTDEDLATFHDVQRAIAADAIEIDGVKVAPSEPTGHVKQSSLDHMAFRGLADGKLAHFEMKGLAVDGDADEPGFVKLAGASLDGLSADAARPSLDRLALDGFAMDIPNNDWGKGARMMMTVAHAAYEAPGLVVGKLPPKAELSIDHAIVQVPPQSSAAPVLQVMGYKAVDVSLHTLSRYDAAARTMSLDPLSLNGVDMGTLDLKLDLARVSDNIVSQNDAAQKAAAAAIQVKSLDVSLRNAGLVDKLLAFKAAGDGLSIAQEREAMISSVDVGLAGLGLQDSAKAKLIADAVRRFIAEPKTVHVRLTSQNGLGVDAIPLIDSPQTLLDAVEVTAGADD